MLNMMGPVDVLVGLGSFFEKVTNFLDGVPTVHSAFLVSEPDLEVFHAVLLDFGAEVQDQKQDLVLKRLGQAVSLGGGVDLQQVFIFFLVRPNLLALLAELVAVLLLENCADDVGVTIRECFELLQVHLVGQSQVELLAVFAALIVVSLDLGDQGRVSDTG